MENRNILLKNGRLITGGNSFISDILFSGGTVSRIAENIEPDGSMTVVDITGCIVSYGLADVHVHFREPGYSAKETIATGSRAAARGGYTVVGTMPNLNPAPDSPENLQVQLDLIREQAVIDVLPFATITGGRNGGPVVDMAAMKDKVMGFSDDGSGVQAGSRMEEAMRMALREDVVISAHCEDMDEAPFSSESEWKQVCRDAKMAAEIGCRYHVCHVSTAESVDAVRQAKAAGARVSCETAPHYLTLTEDDRLDEGRFRMNPPLRTKADRDALIMGIQDGSVEVIATDHAPHTAEEKSKGYWGSMMGIVGLETAFPVMYTKLVKEGVITIEKLIELMCDNPRRIFSLGGKLAEGERADIAVFELDKEYVINPEDFETMGRSTPFEGWKVCGRCVLTLKDGVPVHSELPQISK